MKSRFYQARDGLRLHYLDHPCVDAECTRYCILLHGFTNDAHVWDRLAAELQQTHHVIALDQRGHGDSDWDPEQRYSHWTLAEDLQDFLQHLQREFAGATWHVVGHSLGARVAMLALEAAALPVASLTLIDAGPEVNAEAGERLVSDVMQLPEHYADAQAFRECLARIYVMAHAEALEHMARFGLRVRQGRLTTKTDPAFTPGIWHKTPALQAMHKDRGGLNEQLWRALRSLDMPVHVIRGQASSILEPALVKRMAQALGDGAECSVVPRAGHAVMVDNPADSTALIARFIRTHDETPCEHPRRQGASGKRA
ncbi:MAG TPA: alpha/beta hydrolase [Pseudomonadales bacterium]